jgi:hypothetical protein
MTNANYAISEMSHYENEATMHDWAGGGHLELTDDELGLVLGGNASAGQEDSATKDSSGGFQQANGNVADSAANGAVAGGVAGAAVGALFGSFGGPAGTMAGAMGGAEVGALAGGSLAASAAVGWELGTTYSAEINAFMDGFAEAAQEYQNNPPPI